MEGRVAQHPVDGRRGGNSAKLMRDRIHLTHSHSCVDRRTSWQYHLGGSLYESTEDLFIDASFGGTGEETEVVCCVGGGSHTTQVAKRLRVHTPRAEDWEVRCERKSSNGGCPNPTCLSTAISPSSDAHSHLFHRADAVFIGHGAVASAMMQRANQDVITRLRAQMQNGWEKYQLAWSRDPR